MRNETIELNKWEFILSDEEGRRFNASAKFIRKPDDNWIKIFKDLIDLFFENPEAIEKIGLKYTPQYSYNEIDSILTIMDITEEDFEKIEPFISKTVKDMNEKTYPSFLKNKEDEKEKNNLGKKEYSKFEKARIKELKEKFNE